MSDEDQFLSTDALIVEQVIGFEKESSPQRRKHPGMGRRQNKNRARERRVGVPIKPGLAPSQPSTRQVLVWRGGNKYLIVEHPLIVTNIGDQGGTTSRPINWTIQSPPGKVFPSRKKVEVFVEVAPSSSEPTSTSSEQVAAQLGSENNPSTETVDVGKRLNVKFTEQAYLELQEFARTTNRPISEVVRHALALEQWFEKIKREGGRVLVERNGEIRELISV